MLLTCLAFLIEHAFTDKYFCDKYFWTSIFGGRHRPLVRTLAGFRISLRDQVRQKEEEQGYKTYRHSHSRIAWLYCYSCLRAELTVLAGYKCVPSRFSNCCTNYAIRGCHGAGGAGGVSVGAKRCWSSRKMVSLCHPTVALDLLMNSLDLECVSCVRRGVGPVKAAGG